MITILDPPSFALIPSHLSEVVEYVSDLYRRSYGERLMAVYMFGSAVRGDFRPDLSDMDLVGIVTVSDGEDKQRLQSIKVRAHEKFQWVRFDLDLYPLPKLNEKLWLQFYLLAGGLCMWGSSYDPPCPLPTDERELAGSLGVFLLERYDRIYRMLGGVFSSTRELDADVLKQLCANHAKRAIRLANAIVILRTGLYTNSTETMTKLVAVHVPEISEIVDSLHSYRLSPSADFDRVIQFLGQAELIRDFVLCHDVSDLGANRKGRLIHLCFCRRRLLLAPIRKLRWYLQYGLRVCEAKARCRVVSRGS